MPSRVLLFFAAGLLACGCAAAAERAPDITGAWVTYDDETGRKKSIVTIKETNGAVSGVVTEVYFQPGDQQICVKCEGEKHNQSIVGLEIFRGLTYDGAAWRGGTILDPKNGKEYDCELRLEGEALKVRGYLLFFFRTQTWARPEALK